ncbi:hypothetical protein RvY_13868 [Ramazzottius varieornatus]|uniref:Uncharacterized protein n=1 Tax=Ramazzottius varieornatus TaxID=947166 RepID=A0A1D1VPD5_RAMVA|nr:hypothetical protein RvY_13868 [Ramazzottius varieornatus]
MEYISCPDSRLDSRKTTNISRPARQQGITKVSKSACTAWVKTELGEVQQDGLALPRRNPPARGYFNLHRYYLRPIPSSTETLIKVLGELFET